ncbi:MAG: glycosyltransferase family 2 protein [Nanoarchaeota archaeon]|nr:glycosyltransferase family 2 protein [Nanoarchaeota archaeon]
MEEKGTENIKYPKVSIIIPTYNEEEYIDTCLGSIFKQDYPGDKLEVIVVDDESKDRTLEIVKKYPVKVMTSGKHDPELSKKIGFEAATGDFFMYQDADIELPGRDWLKRMIYPLIDDSTIVGAFPPLGPKREDFALNRYLAYQEFMLDPMLEYFCPSIKSSVVEKRQGYYVCRINPQSAPLIGNCFIRTEILKKLMDKEEKYVDVDVPILLAGLGYDKLAYVPEAPFYHFFVKNLGEFLSKFKKRLNTSFLPSSGARKYSYIDLSNAKGVLKLAVWIIYANLFFPSLVRGIYKSLKHKDIACFYEPVVAIALTDYMIFSVLRTQSGRKYMFTGIKNFFGKLS